MGQVGVLTLLARAALTLHLLHFAALGMEVAPQDANGVQPAFIPGRRQLAAARNSAVREQHQVSKRKNHKGIGAAKSNEWDIAAAEDRKDFSGFPEQDVRIQGTTIPELHQRNHSPLLSFPLQHARWLCAYCTSYKHCEHLSTRGNTCVPLQFASGIIQQCLRTPKQSSPMNNLEQETCICWRRTSSYHLGPVLALLARARLLCTIFSSLSSLCSSTARAALQTLWGFITHPSLPGCQGECATGSLCVYYIARAGARNETYIKSRDNKRVELRVPFLD